jgi:adenylate cyclase
MPEYRNQIGPLFSGDPGFDADLSKASLSVHMGPGIEIENKYLIDKMPDLSGHNPTVIQQGYLCLGVDGNEVRLRRRGDQYSLGMKGDGTIARQQAFIDINAEQFATLWPAASKLEISKLRYELPYGDYLIELDVFQGPLQGLVVAEVEFRSEDHKSQFRPPAWFGPDVTHDPQYQNKNLALKANSIKP